jgi:hypothetical protein
MKIHLIICILAILLSHLSIFAQSEPIEIEAENRTFFQIFDSISTGLVPSRIPHGVLYDRVYPWSSLNLWQLPFDNWQLAA